MSDVNHSHTIQRWLDYVRGTSQRESAMSNYYFSEHTRNRVISRQRVRKVRKGTNLDLAIKFRNIIKVLTSPENQCNMSETLTIGDRHMITGINEIATFILAGKSFFTIQNTETGNRYTYKVCRSTNPDGTIDENKKLWFVSVLTGSDNENSYEYLGCIKEGFDGTFFRTKKSRITQDAVSFKGFAWLFNTIKAGIELPEKAKFYHEGRCGRCGRKLTTPESVESGYGPICVGLLGF